ncbi:MAG: AAA family ATPase, partial [Kofleriaceae bacterium]|nr:AAA family ATPase [Kofleriaceae bacterium]
VVHVTGPSGIGKTALVRQFTRRARAEHGAWVLRGRCHERERIPYKGLDGVVEQLAAQLRGGADEVVHGRVPRWSAELVQLFPILATVPAIGARPVTQKLEPRELRRRGWLALAELLAAVTRHHPLVVCVDDLQWSDRDTVEVLRSLLTLPGALIATTFRADDAAASDALGTWIAATADATTLDLGPLSADDAAALAGAALASHGASTTDPGALGAEAMGIPFFIEQLAHHQARAATGAPRTSLDDVLAARVGDLDARAAALLRAVAVAGGPVEQAVALEAAGLDGTDLPVLWQLRAASFLRAAGVASGDLVELHHDRLRDFVLGGLRPEARVALHRTLAAVTVARHGDADGPWLFDVVRHVEAAAASLPPAERHAAADLALRAGRHARAGAAFTLASACFENGLTWAGDDAWERDHAAALALATGAAEAAYLTGSAELLAGHIATIRARGADVLEQLPAWELEIDAAAGRGDFGGAIASARAAARLLGVEIPVAPDDAVIGAALERALGALQRLGPDGVRALRDADDPRVAAVMRILVRVSPVAFFAAPSLVPILASELVTRSLERGLAPATAYAMALIGLVLNMLGAHDAAHGWAQLALDLLPRWRDDRRLEASTRQVAQNLVDTFVVPLASTLDAGRAVFDVGRDTGDLEYAGYAAHVYTFNALYSGARPLGPLLDEALDLGGRMRAMGQLNANHVHAPFEQVLRALRGRTADPARLDGDGFDEAAAIAAATALGSRSGAMVVHTARGYVRLFLGDAVDALACLDQARAYFDAVPSLWHIPIVHLLGAAAAALAWDRLPADQRATQRAAIAASLDALRGYARHGAVNFAHKVALVEGVAALVDGDRAAARARLA